MSSDADLVVAVLGNGPCTEMRLVGRMRERCQDWHEAETRTKNAITEAVQGKRIEMFRHGCYQLATGAARMEEKADAP